MVENGYEIFSHKIEFEPITNEHRTFEKKVEIFFKKDYSSTPYLFFTLNKLQNFFLNEDKLKSNDKKKIMISLTSTKIRTSYFEVNFKITTIPDMPEDLIIPETRPYIILEYIVLNNLK